jgi:hypothetical protein
MDRKVRPTLVSLLLFSVCDSCLILVRWDTRYENGNGQVKGRIFNFAMTKLLCKAVDEDLIPTRQDILAIMGLRLGLRLSSKSKSDADVAKELVERHMRVLMGINWNSQTITALAPSEPVLAEASIQLMRQLRKLRPAQALQQTLEDSLHTREKREELIAAFLLLLARDEAQQAQEGCAKIPVKTFLEKLLGTKVLKFHPNISKPGKEDMTLEDAFKGAYVHFTHVIVVQQESSLTREEISRLIARGALPVWPLSGRSGFDLMIPVIQGDTVKASTVTAIFIQVKNDTASDSACDQFFYQMNPEYTKFLSPHQYLEDFEHPFIRIVMAFQGSQSGVTRHYLTTSERNDCTTYDIVCRGFTHHTYKVIKESDEENWRRCLEALGDDMELFKRPDGTPMSYEEEKTTRSRMPGVYFSKRFPPRWVKKTRD